MADGTEATFLRATINLRNLHVAPYLELDEVLVAENIANINATLEFMESIDEGLGRKETTLRVIAEKDQLDSELKASSERKQHIIAIEVSDPEPGQLDQDESHPRWTAFHENANLRQSVKKLQEQFAALLARSLSEMEILKLQKDVLCRKERLIQDAQTLKQYSDAVDKPSSTELSAAMVMLQEEKEKTKSSENARMNNAGKKAKMENDKKHQEIKRNLLDIGEKQLQLEIEKRELRKIKETSSSTEVLNPSH